MVKVLLSPGRGTEHQGTSRDGHHSGYASSSGGFIPKSRLWPLLLQSPSQVRPCLCPLSGSLKDIQAWSEGIQGQAAQNDPDHTPASFLWFLSDIRRGFKNFPQGRGSPNVGLAPGLVPKLKVGHRGGRRQGI